MGCLLFFLWLELRMVAMYVYWLSSKVFATVILPWKVRPYLIQFPIFLSTFSNIVWKLSCRCFNLLSIVMPRTVKESTHFRLRSLHIVSLAKLPTGTTNVLSKLHFRPDTAWKRSSILEKYLKFSLVLKTMALRSSAKNSDLASFFAKTTPVRFLV